MQRSVSDLTEVDVIDRSIEWTIPKSSNFYSSIETVNNKKKNVKTEHFKGPTSWLHSLYVLSRVHNTHHNLSRTASLPTKNRPIDMEIP